ncbi:MAG: hypothetical protein LBU13_03750 [Synergistaceae bacterium]|jgi:septal ring factor EnvC (AmiA/AmiB activator)|nr:hypothetical protein [Synergistaceae bacterium]
MNSDITSQLLIKLDDVLRELAALQVKVEKLTDDLEEHQERLTALSDCVTAIKVERAAERGYVAGALAVGGVLGGVLAKMLF